MGDKYGYTTKTYNLLGLALMIKSDYERALKIFESALAELKLSTPEGEAKHLYSGNSDLAVLLTNYIKCNCIVKGGCGSNAIEFLKTDPINVSALTYLGKVNQTAIQEFFEERKRSETIFDEAVRNLQ